MATGNENLRTAKSRLRAETKEALGRMNRADRQRLSSLICDRIISLSAWTESDDLLLFDAMAEEVDTGPLITNASREGKVIYLPRIHGNEIHFHIFIAADLKPHSYGMMEPPDGAPMWQPAVTGETPRRTVIICPGLAFDGHGGRLGRGKGFYDQFLSTLGDCAGRIGVTVVGICFGVQLTDRVPTGPGDQLMDAVVTENRTIVAEP